MVLQDDGVLIMREGQQMCRVILAPLNLREPVDGAFAVVRAELPVPFACATSVAT